MRAGTIFAALVLAALQAASQRPVHSPIPAPPPPPSTGWQDVSLADYRKHLEALSAVVANCARTRDAKACAPALVGQDDRVSLGNTSKAEQRPVRYDWLRVLLQQAQKKDASPAAKSAAAAKSISPVAGALPPPASTTQLLQAAEKRLADDSAQAGATLQAEPGHPSQRAVLDQVMAGREFRGLERTTPGQTLAEKIDNWLNSLFAGAARLGASAPWLGHAVVIAFILVVCVGLVWGLLQMERRWRIRLTPEGIRTAPDAPSARNWQLWMEDARKAAAAGLWREAIHFAYWAAIARMESSRLWPADRSRTPREYLALLATEDPRRAGLASLTRSFERTWYGGRAAGESDFKDAEELANALIAADRNSATRRPGAVR